MRLRFARCGKAILSEGFVSLGMFKGRPFLVASFLSTRLLLNQIYPQLCASVAIAGMPGPFCLLTRSPIPVDEAMGKRLDLCA
jgi:hypothetical protein